jgi:hypothetical protein
MWQGIQKAIKGRQANETTPPPVTATSLELETKRSPVSPTRSGNETKNPSVTGGKPKAAFSLKDPRNVSSEWNPADRDITIEYLDDWERDMVKLLHTRMEESWRISLPYRRVWWQCLAFVHKNYWLAYDASGRFTTRKDPNDPYRAYTACNIIDPLMKKNATRVSQAKPDANVKPRTGGEKDRGAAAEGRAILATTDHQFNRLVQTYGLIFAAQTFGGAYLKVIWNPAKKATIVTDMDPATGEVKAIAESPVGDIDEHIRTPLEIFIDPKSSDRQDIAWLIEARLVSLNYVQEKFGDDANQVQGGDVPDWYIAGIANYRAAVTGDVLTDQQLLDPEARKYLVLLLECWEKPSRRYPSGRLITVAGNKVVRYEEWPYDKKDEFPYVYLPFHTAVSTPYSEGLVEPLLPLQDSYNHIQSQYRGPDQHGFPHDPRPRRRGDRRGRLYVPPQLPHGLLHARSHPDLPGSAARPELLAGGTGTPRSAHEEHCGRRGDQRGANAALRHLRRGS